MDDIKNELKNESSTKNNLKKVKSNEIIENKNNSNSETKQHRELENTITAMLDQVMEDPDDTYSTSNHVINSLQFNDDESIEDDFVDPKINRNFIHSHFDRSNKRLKTVINYPVNMPNMPIMNVNPFSYGNNISSMRAPSFGFDSSMNYNNINNFNENNYIGHKSSNNLFNNIYLDQSFNNQMNNNANMNTFISNRQAQSAPTLTTIRSQFPESRRRRLHCRNLSPVSPIHSIRVKQDQRLPRQQNSEARPPASASTRPPELFSVQPTFQF